MYYELETGLLHLNAVSSGSVQMNPNDRVVARATVSHYELSRARNRIQAIYGAPLSVERYVWLVAAAVVGGLGRAMRRTKKQQI
jgi:hypothetical protein